MKAIKIANEFQIVKEVPREWLKYPIYSVIKKPIRADQKHCLLKDVIVNEDKKTITFTIIELTPVEYDAKLKKEGALLIEDMKSLVSSLEIGAKRIAIGKTGTREYIDTQERIYTRKYKIAKGELLDYNNFIENEATEIGASFEDYKALIIQKYEQGLGVYEGFLSMIERTRSKFLFFVETNKNHKAKELIELMKSIKTNTSVEEIQTIMNVILNYK